MSTLAYNDHHCHNTVIRTKLEKAGALYKVAEASETSSIENSRRQRDDGPHAIIQKIKNKNCKNAKSTDSIQAVGLGQVLSQGEQRDCYSPALQWPVSPAVMVWSTHLSLFLE